MKEKHIREEEVNIRNSYITFVNILVDKSRYKSKDSQIIIDKIFKILSYNKNYSLNQKKYLLNLQQILCESI